MCSSARGRSTSLSRKFDALSALSSESDGKRYVRYQVIGKNEVAVPTHFYKVIAKEKVAGMKAPRPNPTAKCTPNRHHLFSSGKGISSIESYILPNAPIDNKVSIRLLFFSLLFVYV